MTRPAHSNSPVDARGAVRQSVDALVREARAGDDAAFAALFRAHYEGLCTFVYRFVRDRTTAEEVVQDLFARLCDGGASIPAGAITRAYLYGAARNLALNQLRRDRVVRRWSDPNVDADAPDEGTRPDASVEYGELVTLVRSAVATMPARPREVFLLSRQHELTYGEIARVLGLSPKTVESHMMRALKVLRAALAGYGGVAIVVATAWGAAVWSPG